MASEWYLKRLIYDGEYHISHSLSQHTIGRAKSSVIRCVSLYVSRDHCRIQFTNSGELLIRDLNSSNGTFVNGTKLPTDRWVQLVEGDEIGLGVDHVDDDKCFVYKLNQVVQQNTQECVKQAADSATSPKVQDDDIIIISEESNDEEEEDNDKEKKDKTLTLARKRPGSPVDSKVFNKVRCIETRVENKVVNGGVPFNGDTHERERKLSCDPVKAVPTSTSVTKLASFTSKASCSKVPDNNVRVKLEPVCDRKSVTKCSTAFTNRECTVVTSADDSRPNVQDKTRMIKSEPSSVSASKLGSKSSSIESGNTFKLNETCSVVNMENLDVGINIDQLETTLKCTANVIEKSNQKRPSTLSTELVQIKQEPGRRNSVVSCASVSTDTSWNMEPNFIIKKEKDSSLVGDNSVSSSQDDSVAVVSAANYSMEDDVICISDDDDEYIGSSQRESVGEDVISNGDNVSGAVDHAILSNVDKKTGQVEEANNQIYDEESGHDGSEDSESENEWWPKLSQNFLEEIEVGEKNLEKACKDVRVILERLPESATTTKSSEESLTDDDIFDPWLKKHPRAALQLSEDDNEDDNSKGRHNEIAGEITGDLRDINETLKVFTSKQSGVRSKERKLSATEFIGASRKKGHDETDHRKRESSSDEDIFSKISKKKKRAVPSVEDSRSVSSTSLDRRKNHRFRLSTESNDIDEQEDAASTSKQSTKGDSISEKKPERRFSLEMQKSARGPQLIAAPPMPKRKAHERGITAERANSLHKEQTTKVLEESTSASSSKTKEDKTARRKSRDDEEKSKGKHKAKKDRLKGPSLFEKVTGKPSSKHSDDNCQLPRSVKKEIQDKRKAKLMEITLKKKEQEDAKERAEKVRAKPCVKVTEKNRGAFLTEISMAEKAKAESKVKAREDKIKVNKAGTSKSATNKDYSSKSSKNESVIVNKENTVENSRSVKQANFRIPLVANQDIIRKDSSPSSEILAYKNCTRISILGNSQDPAEGPSSEATISAAQKKGILVIGNGLLQPKKKHVTFAEEPLIRIIESRTKTRTPFPKGCKDAPMPMPPPPTRRNNQVPRPMPVDVNCLPLEEVIYNICMWNPKWFEEQKGKSDPPPVYGKYSLHPMLTNFLNYKDYFNIVYPLMLVELWTRITKEWDERLADLRKALKVLIAVDNVTFQRSTGAQEKQLMTIECHALLPESDAERNNHPQAGEMVLLELHVENTGSVHDIQMSQSTSRFYIPIFGYVEYAKKYPMHEKEVIHQELLRCINPNTRRQYFKLTLQLKTKARNVMIQKSQAMKLSVVSYIRSELRSFQALKQLAYSPLCEDVLNPTINTYRVLTPVDSTIFFKEPLNEAQKKAVLQTTEACLKSQHKISLIQGPPGTGKSHVIVALIMQLLYGQNTYQKHGNRENTPRILLCAPSNAAVDELVVRLLRVRATLDKAIRFKLVRTGRSDYMNQEVRNVSLNELVKRNVEKLQNEKSDNESAAIEVETLKAKRNALEMAKASAEIHNRAVEVMKIERKISDLDRRLSLVSQKNVLTPREKQKQMMETQTIMLAGADIVATTLSSCLAQVMEKTFLPSGSRSNTSAFTCCIVDESSQCAETDTLIPLVLGVSKLVLVGDPEQLPATIMSRVAKDRFFEQSLFSRINRKFSDMEYTSMTENPVQLLNIQYRMHPEICTWPGNYFYAGKLTTAPEINRVSCLRPYVLLDLNFTRQESRNASMNSSMLNETGLCSISLSSGCPVNAGLLGGYSRELFNHDEARCVSELSVGLLQVVRRFRLNVGVITPYQKQKFEIQNRINELQSRKGYRKDDTIEVNTIDSFQGKEKDVVILSCVRTDGVGFLADEQRLNVALTRARYSLIIVGNFKSLVSERMWKELIRDAENRHVKFVVPEKNAHNREELMRAVLLPGNPHDKFVRKSQDQ